MIEVNNIGKGFKLYAKPAHRLKEILLRRPYHTRYQALDNISFKVENGQTFGIIGKNGAGKSTLLKILCGVLLPDDGQIHIDGKITGLLELGTGFDFELTGMQNITANGLLLGMEHEEIEHKRAQIIAFSELGDFIYEPIRTYSSGMVMRLAFSIAIHADPTCFVVDEALSVGDAHFQQKCMRKINEFRKSGGSIVFVSHDMNAVKMLCDRAIVIDGGRVVADGAPDAVVNHYNRLMAELDDAPMALDRVVAKSDYGSREFEILSASVCGQHSDSHIISSGEPTDISITVQANQNTDDISLGFMIRDRFGQDIFGTNSYYLGTPLPLKAGQSYTLTFRMPMDIGPGKYTLTVALHTEDNHIETCYHWCDNLAEFEVAGIDGALFSGICKLNPTLLHAK